jgi:predicted nucleic acid-binding protein
MRKRLVFRIFLSPIFLSNTPFHPKLQSLHDLLDDAVVLDVTEAVGRKLGEVRAGLLDAGKPTPDMNLLIAATALVHNCPP